METDNSEYERKNAKLIQKVSCRGHVNHFWNFGTSRISLERLKLETSNLGRGQTVLIYTE